MESGAESRLARSICVKVLEESEHYFFFHSPIRKSVLLVSLGGRELRTICLNQNVVSKTRRKPIVKKEKEKKKKMPFALTVC